jgi:Protein of unknown function (DUF2815)
MSNPLPISVLTDPNNPKRITISNVRVAYANTLDTPQTNQEPDGTVRRSYNAAFIMDKSAPGMAEAYEAIMKALYAAAIGKWGDKAASQFQVLKAQNRLALHDGAEKADKTGFGPEVVFLNASAKESDPPRLLNNLLDPATGKVQELRRPQSRIYSGCYARVQVLAWAQDNANGGKRLNTQVLAVQFLADGESFGGGGGEADLDAFTGVPAPVDAMGFDAPAPTAAAAPVAAPAAPAFGFGAAPVAAPVAAPAAPSFGMPTF